MLYLQIGYAVRLLTLAEFLNSSAGRQERKGLFFDGGKQKC